MQVPAHIAQFLWHDEAEHTAAVIWVRGGRRVRDPFEFEYSGQNSVMALDTKDIRELLSVYSKTKGVAYLVIIAGCYQIKLDAKVVSNAQRRVEQDILTHFVTCFWAHSGSLPLDSVSCLFFGALIFGKKNVE